MIEKNAVYKNNFYEIIQSEIATNPEVVNTQGKHLSGDSYIAIASYSGYINKVSYLLENKANIYLLNKNKENALHEAVTGCKAAIEEKSELRLKNCLQVFKILLNYEAEQRAYFPEKDQNIALLKDQKHYLNWTPLELAEKPDFPRKKELITKLKKALEEAEKYYQKCLENKAKDIPMQPYHRQFLPEIIREENVVVEKEEVKWSDKIASQANIHQRRRSKSAAENASEPKTVMKLRSRSSEVGSFDEQKPLLSVDENVSKKESWTEWFSRMVISANSKNKNEKTL